MGKGEIIMYKFKEFFKTYLHILKKDSSPYNGARKFIAQGGCPPNYPQLGELPPLPLPPSLVRHPQ